MYRVTMDGLVLFDTELEDYALFDTQVALEVNTTGFFEFTMFPEHPLYDRVIQMKSKVIVYQNKKPILYSRVLNITVNFNKSKTIICEGFLGYLNDAVLPPYNFNGTISEYLTMFIDRYNDTIKPDMKFALGEITVEAHASTEALIRSNSEYSNLFEELSTKTFKSNLGGYLSIRVVNDIIYLDYLKDTVAKSNQVIELGQNLLDLSRTTMSDDLITGIIPLGAKLEDENGEETDERLTITSVNDGSDFLLNSDAADKYGIIMITQIWDDVTVPMNLYTRGIDVLTQRSSLIDSIEISAVDLAMVDIDIDAIDVFEYIRVISEPHGFDKFAMITSRTLDLTNPQNNSFTFGFASRSFTSGQVETGKIVEDIKKDYVPNEKLKEVREDMTTLESSIEQSAENVRIELSKEFTSTSDFDEYREFVSTQFEQSAEGWDFMFKELQEYVNNIDDGNQSAFAEIIKYIRFVNGTIILGEVNNPLTFEISNSKASFKQNGMEVAYISDNMLYITDGYFINSLRIGQFIFRPRKNGSLSFGKVG